VPEEARGKRPRESTCAARVISSRKVWKGELSRKVFTSLKRETTAKRDSIRGKQRLRKLSSRPDRGEEAETTKQQEGGKKIYASSVKGEIPIPVLSGLHAEGGEEHFERKRGWGTKEQDEHS